MNEVKPSNIKKWAVLGIAPIAIGAIHYASATLQSQGNWAETIFLMVGMFGGFGLLLADAEWLHQYYFKGAEENTHDESMSPELITRSALFIMTLVPLTIYMLTSTGSALGMGLLLGILIGLSLEMFTLRLKPLEFKARFLTQIKRVYTGEEIEWIAIIFSGFTVVVSLLVVL